MKSILIIGLLIGIVVLLLKYLKVRYNGINGHNILINGGSGSGKTGILTYLSIKLYIKNLVLWWFDRYIILYLKKFYVLLFIKKQYKNDFYLKYNNIYKIDKPILISNYPIKFFNKFISYKFNLDILLCKVYLPYNSVVCLSEMQNIANQYTYKDEYKSNLFVKWLTQHRHFDNSYFLCDTQSLDNLFNGITRSCSQVITAMGVRRFLFFKYINLSVDNSGLFDVKNVDLNKRKLIYLFNPYKLFNSRFNKYLIYTDKFDMSFRSSRHLYEYNDSESV